MVNLYSANWDLVLGAFYYEKFAAILNTIELEAMACKAPIIACDLNEIIFKPLDEIENLAYKIIDDKEFRKAYVEKNYKYVLKVHSTKNVAKIYEKYIEDL
ncbi:MAG: hypothetical protein LBC61_06395 [Candidatus Peribacteria bacterium]|jgi:glycosyltransferase involved in cell wall biosynthesis|nr:hypothetical protein [Candidatus Peribacteria bacterium]